MAEWAVVLVPFIRSCLDTNMFNSILIRVKITIFYNCVLDIKVVVVGAGADAVDYKLISICHKGDIVVSQDYGVAAMALGKGAYAIHQSGKWYTDDNIDQMLMERHLSKKARRSSRKCHVKEPKKRTEEDDERFAQSFEKMLLIPDSVSPAVSGFLRLLQIPPSAWRSIHEQYHGLQPCLSHVLQWRQAFSPDSSKS